MLADLGSSILTAFQSLFSNAGVECKHTGWKIRSVSLIHSLFKGIFSFELELRFTSTVMIHETSAGPQSLYDRAFLNIKNGQRHREETSVSSKFIKSLPPKKISWCGKMWQAQWVDMNSNKASTRQKKKDLTRGILKTSQELFPGCVPLDD